MSFLHASQKTRNPIKKFVFTKKLSEERKGRAKEYIPPFCEKIVESNYASIFHAAEEILQMPMPKNSKIVFVGQGMRPLFETTRAINEYLQLHKRRTIRYFVAPSPSPWMDESDCLKLMNNFVAKLSEFGIASKKTSNYFIVDRGPYGKTLSRITDAIKEINPEAKIIAKSFTGTMEADNIMRPTLKNKAGDIRKHPIKEISNSHLEFQRRLKDYLDNRFPEQRKK